MARAHRRISSVTSRVFLAALLAAGVSTAALGASDEPHLPPAPQFLGPLHRAPDGSIVADISAAVPAPPTPPSAPQPAEMPRLLLPRLADHAPKPDANVKVVERLASVSEIRDADGPDGWDLASCEVVRWQPNFDLPTCRRALAAARTRGGATAAPRDSAVAPPAPHPASTPPPATAPPQPAPAATAAAAQPVAAAGAVAKGPEQWDAASCNAARWLPGLADESCRRSLAAERARLTVGGHAPDGAASN